MLYAAHCFSISPTIKSLSLPGASILRQTFTFVKGAVTFHVVLLSKTKGSFLVINLLRIKSWHIFLMIRFTCPIIFCDRRGGKFVDIHMVEFYHSTLFKYTES